MAKWGWLYTIKNINFVNSNNMILEISLKVASLWLIKETKTASK